MASSSAAITAVFPTTELAEAVLANLDSFYNIVRVMRVGKKFKDVIRGMRSAQQHLFLEPNWDDTEYVAWRMLSNEISDCATFVTPDGKERVGE